MNHVWKCWVIALGVLTVTACGLDRQGFFPSTAGVGGAGGTATATGGTSEMAGGGVGDGAAGSVGGSGGGVGGAPPSCSGICVFEPPMGGELVVTRDTTSCPTGWETELSVYDGTDPGCPTCSCDNTVVGGGCLADVVVERWFRS